jgi:hypothetical protein
LFESTRRDIYCRYPQARRRSVFDIFPGAAPMIRKTRIFYHAARAACVTSKRFSLSKKIVTLEQFQKPRVTFLDEPDVEKKIHDANIVFVSGWRFRAPRAMQQHAQDVRDFFRPVADVVKNGEESIARLRRNSDIVIGVHIRHGDYRDWHGGKYFFEPSRYAAWMREAAAQFSGKVSFFVCSNEPRSREEFSGLNVEIGAGPAVSDLFALARCDYLIAPLGTFSQWASFYGNVPLLHLRGKEQRIEREGFHVSFFEEIP